MVKHFIHRSTHRSDPAFLHDERAYIERQRDGFAVMERHRDQLQRDIENARRAAHGLGISLAHAPESGYRAWLALIGVGNRFRRDDAAGLEVASRLRATRPPGVRILEEEGEPGRLIHDFELMKEVLIVDAISTGGRPGDLYRFDATHEPLPAETFRPSTHSLGVADAIELARELRRLPERIAVYGIEGADFTTGEGLTPPVLDTVEALAAELHAELGGVELAEAAAAAAEPGAGARAPTMLSLDDVGVIRTMLEAVLREDRDAFIACLTPDVEWDDREGWPAVRQMYHGHAGVREWWDRFMRAGGDVLDAKVEEIASHDPRMLIGVLGTFRGRSGVYAEFKARAWYVFTLRRGKVSSARLFWDRTEALQAAGLLERDQGAR